MSNLAPGRYTIGVTRAVGQCLTGLQIVLTQTAVITGRAGVAVSGSVQVNGSLPVGWNFG